MIRSVLIEPDKERYNLISVGFKEGLNVIVGRNGSGKTTILKVIKSLFTGEKPPPGPFIVVFEDLNANLYVARRTVESITLSLVESRMLSPVFTSSSIEEVAKFISENIVKVSPETFINNHCMVSDEPFYIPEAPEVDGGDDFHVWGDAIQSTIKKLKDQNGQLKRELLRIAKVLRSTEDLSLSLKENDSLKQAFRLDIGAISVRELKEKIEASQAILETLDPVVESYISCNAACALSADLNTLLKNHRDVKEAHTRYEALKRSLRRPTKPVPLFTREQIKELEKLSSNPKAPASVLKSWNSAIISLNYWEALEADEKAIKEMDVLYTFIQSHPTLIEIESNIKSMQSESERLYLRQQANAALETLDIALKALGFEDSYKESPELYAEKAKNYLEDVVRNSKELLSMPSQKTGLPKNLDLKELILRYKIKKAHAKSVSRKLEDAEKLKRAYDAVATPYIDSFIHQFETLWNKTFSSMVLNSKGALRIINGKARIGGKLVHNHEASAVALAKVSGKLTAFRLISGKRFPVFLGDEVDAPLHGDRFGVYTSIMESIAEAGSQLILTSHKSFGSGYEVSLDVAPDTSTLAYSIYQESKISPRESDRRHISVV